MMQPFRPDSKQASRRFATQSSELANTADFRNAVEFHRSAAEFKQQRSPVDSVVGYGMVQQQNNVGASPYGYADCSTVANMPVVYTMQNVFNNTNVQEGEWQNMNCGGSSPNNMQPMQPMQYIVMQPMEPMRYQPFQNCEGPQTSEAIVPAVPLDEVRMDQQHSLSGMHSHELQMWSGSTDQSPENVLAQRTSSARRQRRLRQRAKKYSPVAQLPSCSEEVAECSSASQGASEKSTRASTGDEFPMTPCMSWADALEEEVASGPPQKLSFDWKSFQAGCFSATFKVASTESPPRWADATDADEPSNSVWADATRSKIPSDPLEMASAIWVAPANKEQPEESSQASVTVEKRPIVQSMKQAAKKQPMKTSEQVHDEMSLEITSPDDDASNADAAVDPVLSALENVDGETFHATLAECVSSAWWLTWTKRGSRIIQKAIEIGSADDQQLILGQLRGRVLEVLKSPHANHVLQKSIEIMPSHRLTFVISEIQGCISFAARHRFGCRILQRLIEHCQAWQTEDLIMELLSDSARLCKHQYGNFVIQHILQHGMPAHRKSIAIMLCQDTMRLAKHRIASYVISCAVSHCATEDVQALTQVVRHDAGQFADLSRRQYGSFVVREVNKAARLLQCNDQGGD
jgi:hypothetical protein